MISSGLLRSESTVERGCTQPGCGEAAVCPSRFCRGHLVTRAVKARNAWSLVAKAFGLVALVLLLALPRPWKAWSAIPVALAAASTALCLRAGQVISGKTESGRPSLPPSNPI